ncbi:GerW family sporulation protein [Butyrivibrio sp. AE3004]|uniref:GerW family sporulation protein n=1 Tax=Butyrivibrio sp. AE3004 TaxID=1506994 RepID=UPI0004942B8A|nr:GerW family sporulation protein [Butyrivibrio sp. AE3004]
MGDSKFNSVVDSLMNGMNTIMGAKTVVGEATKVGDTIIVPLVDVSFGVGAGASDADKKNSGAGGFAAKMSPSAVLVIKNGQTKLVNIKNQDAVTKILDLVPDIADRFMNRDNDMMDNDSAVDIAFPEEENLE